MSDYTPTLDEAFNATLYTWVDWKQTFASEEEAADAWVRMIAEVERAAIQNAAKWFSQREHEGVRHTTRIFVKFLLSFANKGASVFDRKDLYVYSEEEIKELERAASEKAYERAISDLTVGGFLTEAELEMLSAWHNPYRLNEGENDAAV